MNTKHKAIIIFFMFNAFICGYSQVYNWKALDSTKHIITAGIDWDYSVSYKVAYGYKVNTDIPLILNMSISIPSGENVFDDIKTKVGGQIVIINKSNYKGSLGLYGIYRRYENELVRLQNLGTELNARFGYYKPKWFLAAEISFDKAISTHFKHTETYRNYIYNDVDDGWTNTTAGHFLYGLQSGYSFKKSDITFSFGGVINDNFERSPLVPYYINLGYNYKIN